MKHIGYARISIQEQNITLQTDALKNSGCEKIFVDQITGVSKTRPGLDKAIKALQEGDTLVVWRLDRLGRSLKHLIEIITQLEERNIAFKSLQEAVDTNSSGGKLVFYIFGALAEFERNLIRERTLAGLSAAKVRGKKGGRPNALDHQQQALIAKLYKEGNHSIKEICQIMRISKPTFYRYIRLF